MVTLNVYPCSYGRTLHRCGILLEYTHCMAYSEDQAGARPHACMCLYPPANDVSRYMFLAIAYEATWTTFSLNPHECTAVSVQHTVHSCPAALIGYLEFSWASSLSVN